MICGLGWIPSLSDSLARSIRHDQRGGGMSKILVPTVAVVLVLGVLAGSGGARDRPFGTTRLIAPAFIRPADGGGGGLTDPGGPFSKSQIERFRCASAGNPGCVRRYQLQHDRVRPGLGAGQRDRRRGRSDESEPHRGRVERLLLPLQQLDRCTAGACPDRVFHLVRRRGELDRRADSAAQRQRRGRPAPAFDRRNDVVLMAQLENTGGQGGAFVAQGDVRSAARRTEASPGVSR